MIKRLLLVCLAFLTVGSHAMLLTQNHSDFTQANFNQTSGEVSSMCDRESCPDPFNGPEYLKARACGWCFVDSACSGCSWCPWSQNQHPHKKCPDRLWACYGNDTGSYEHFNCCGEGEDSCKQQGQDQCYLEVRTKHCSCPNDENKKECIDVCFNTYCGSSICCPGAKNGAPIIP